MELQVYLACFCFGLFFVILSALLGHLFGDHGGSGESDVGAGGHADAGFENSGMPGISPFSPTTLSSFITAFGGFGVIFTQIQATRSLWASLPLSLVCATVVAVGVFFFFNWIFRSLQSSSESRVAELAGHDATVITPIPAGGVGEIAYIQGGTRYTAPAREQTGAAIGNGQSVKISRIVGTQFYVTAI